MYYERKGSNKWLMRFMIVQNIKVFQKVVNIIYSMHLYSELYNGTLNNSTSHLPFNIPGNDICSCE